MGGSVDRPLPPKRPVARAVFSDIHTVVDRPIPRAGSTRLDFRPPMKSSTP